MTCVRVAEVIVPTFGLGVGGVGVKWLSGYYRPTHGPVQLCIKIETVGGAYDFPIASIKLI